MVDMSVAIGRTMLANPVMPGSGTFGEGLDAVMDLNRLGAIVAKTITPEPREGCPLPRVVEYKDATLMAIGIPNKGPEHFVREIASFYRRFSPPFVASISAPTADAFGKLAGDVSKPGIDVIEANISCPNLERDGRAFATDPEATEQAIREGRAEAELIPQGTLAERIRAGGAGIPAFYTPAGIDTAYAERREQRTFDGRAYVLERGITTDYALVRAWRADEAGNLLFRRAARNFNPIMAMAARCTIVEVEQPLLAAGEIDPDHVHTSGVYVRRLVPIADGQDRRPIRRRVAGIEVIEQRAGGGPSDG